MSPMRCGAARWCAGWLVPRLSVATRRNGLRLRANGKIHAAITSRACSFFPQLEILELIGQGGMGFVFKARHQNWSASSRFKILPPGTGGGPGFRRKFSREGRRLARLNHPNIVAIHDFGQADGFSTC